MPNYGDSLRALSTMRQATVGAAATAYCWKDFLDYNFDHDPMLEKEVPIYASYTRWPQSVTIPKTRNDEIKITGDIDSTEIGWDLCNALGAPTYSSGAKKNTFIAGIPSPPPLLTASFMEGLNNLWWQGIDGQVSDLEFTIDTKAGRNKFSETLHTKKILPLTSPPTPTYSPPADSSPFAPDLTVVTINTTGFCVVSLKIVLKITSDPFYCTPTTPPTISTERGLSPNRFLNGNFLGTYELVAEYTADAASPFYDYRTNAYEALVVTMYDPYTDLGSGVNPRVIFTLPRNGGTKGKLDRSNPNVLQTVSGVILRDATLGSGFQVDLINAHGAYTGS